MKLKAIISFHAKDLSEDVAAELQYPGFERVTEFMGTEVRGGANEGEFFTVVDESLTVPDWLKSAPKRFSLIWFDEVIPFDCFCYNIETSSTDEGASVAITLRTPLTSEAAFKKTIRMLETFLEPESIAKAEVRTKELEGFVVGKSYDCKKCLREHPPGPCENFPGNPLTGMREVPKECLECQEHDWEKIHPLGERLGAPIQWHCTRCDYTTGILPSGTPHP